MESAILAFMGLVELGILRVVEHMSLPLLEPLLATDMALRSSAHHHGDRAGRGRRLHISHRTLDNDDRLPPLHRHIHHGHTGGPLDLSNHICPGHTRGHPRLPNRICRDHSRDGRIHRSDSALVDITAEVCTW